MIASVDEVRLNFDPAALAPSGECELLVAQDVLGTQNLLQACVNSGVEHLLVSSSGAAYGYHPDNPDWLVETDPLRGNEVFAYLHVPSCMRCAPAGRACSTWPATAR